MSQVEVYSAFDYQAKAILHKTIVQRWKDVAKRFVFSFALPFLCANRIISFMGYLCNGKTDDFDAHLMYQVLMIFSIPIFCFIALANIILFFKYMWPIYVDKYKGKTKTITFPATHYSLPEFDKYYLKTDLPDYPFFEVGYDAYCHVKDQESISIDTLPSSGALVAIKDSNGKPIDVIATST